MKKSKKQRTKKNLIRSRLFWQKKNQASKRTQPVIPEKIRRSKRTRITIEKIPAVKEGINKRCSDVENPECKYCNTRFKDDQNGEKWICCVNPRCGQWLHELCAGHDADSAMFVCEFCIILNQCNY